MATYLETKYLELVGGCLDSFAYGGFDVLQQQFTAPDSQDRRLHRKRWYLYQRGKYLGRSFRTAREAKTFIDKNR